MTRTRPVALTIAGSDPSGGAGIQADLKTFTALGVYGASVITALTAQNTVGVSGVMKVPVDFIRAQFVAVTGDLRVAAAKTGMRGDEETVLAVAALIRVSGLGPVVVDPVMVSTSGDVLLAPSAIAAVREALIPQALVITPNLHEAARLLDREIATNESEVERQAEDLLRFGCRAVLLKGGHGQGTDAIDYLATANGTVKYTKPRIATANTHGTGCTLAAALTAGLAKGLGLEDATAQAKQYLWAALVSGASMHYGAGSGPVDHLHALVGSEE
ncbi:MAG: bifunctional hydroxymethylpyrimidine kinase/phosphomethylpyrimidine kinase [Hyphomicrobium sp.]